MNENNNVYYDLDNDNKKDDFVSQERKSEGYEIPHYQPQYNQAPPQENSGYAIAALVCGIISLVSCMFIAGILAIVFYFVDKNGNDGRSNNLAKIGMILGIVSIVLFVLFIIFYVGIIAVMISSGAY